MTTRHYNKWTINETLNLQREYELLELDIHDIADKHKRSVNSILFKLEQEGFITNREFARGYENRNTTDIETRMINLESNIHNITKMVNFLCNKINEKPLKNNKLFI
jgi:hypothetical protein